MTRTFLLIAGLTALFGFIGLAVGGQAGMLIALAIAAAMNIFAYWNSDKMVLAMYKAQPIERAQNPQLFAMIEHLAQAAKIPMPKAYIIQNDQPNAFATGRNPEHGAVAVTTGLLAQLDERELAGVIAHELAHIKNRDTLTMTITATIAGAIGMLANFAMFFGGNRERGTNPIVMIAVMVLSPIAAMLVQMAISRTREYAADREGAAISGDPLGLASALQRLERGSQIDNLQAEQNPATAHMFIINPLHTNAMDGLFTTHPKTQNRIAKLQALASQMESEPVIKKTASPWG